jgi:hypothetical protein
LTVASYILAGGRVVMKSDALNRRNSARRGLH